LHLRRARYLSMPWRNGSGVTLEIAREPAAGSDFQWRLSLATVATSGPFSTYAGYRRSVTLIDGDGFRLGIGDSDPVVLNSVGATALFPGDASTVCALINGPSSDLSLMVREPGAIVSVTRVQCVAAQVTPLQAGALKALFCLSEDAILALADDSMAGSQGRDDIALALHDTLLLGAQTGAVSVRPSPIGPADLLLLTWRVAGPRSVPCEHARTNYKGYEYSLTAVEAD
jgi:environmental stress-induced protein Ves